VNKEKPSCLFLFRQREDKFQSAALIILGRNVSSVDDDGILNKHYYDLILGEDLSVYPSYYEPWGYTPLESVAFRVPTITTDLAGFGLWVNSLKNQHGINDGVEVLHRSDYNYSEVADGIKDTITLFSTKTDAEIKEIRKRAAQVAEQALWKHFIQYYYEAYDLALRNAMKRQLG
jgi:glycogen synthase